MSAPSLVLDIGGTKIAAGLVDAKGQLLQRNQHPTPRSTDADEVWAAAELAIAEALAAAGGVVSGAGISSAGPIDLTTGSISPVNIAAWRGFPVRDRVAAAVPGVPVRLAGDGLCMALGEHWRGAGQGATFMLGMVVSTGIGGGLVLDGVPYDGRTGNAGHVGHVVVDQHGPPCNCGGRGCVEAIASGPHLVSWAREQGWAGPPDAGAKELADAATAGDGIALRAFRRGADAIAAMIASVAAVCDLDLVVIGGGVAKSGPVLFDPLHAALRSYARLDFISGLRVVPAALGGDAGLVGAAALLRPTLNSPPNPFPPPHPRRADANSHFPGSRHASLRLLAPVNAGVHRRTRGGYRSRRAVSTLARVNAAAAEMIRRCDGVATTAELLTVMTRQQLDVQVRNGGLIRVWRGVYSAAQPDLLMRLRALDLLIGGHAVACLDTAAALYGFGVDDSRSVHVLDPGSRLRSGGGLVVHQREGAPLQLISSRSATSPAWTAVEVARQVRRPRALATLDAALHSGWCSPADLAETMDRHRGRRGIVAVRNLLKLVDGRAESAMESEARLVMLDHGLPRPELQYLIRGRNGESWRVDFAWPEAMVAAEYDSVQWHAGRSEMLRDKVRFAGVQELGWTVIPIVVDDVRRHPARLCERIWGHLNRSSLAS